MVVFSTGLSNMELPKVFSVPPVFPFGGPPAAAKGGTLLLFVKFMLFKARGFFILPDRGSGLLSLGPFFNYKIS
jgi:hypothetical protein